MSLDGRVRKISFTRFDAGCTMREEVQKNNVTYRNLKMEQAHCFDCHNKYAICEQHKHCPSDEGHN